MTAPGRLRRRPGRGHERGAAALEFALMAPVVLLAILGVLQYAYHFWSLETASAAAREAARRVSVGTSWDCVQQEAIDRATLPALTTASIAVTTTYAFATDAVGDVVEVTVTFDSLDLGLFPLPSGGRVSETVATTVQNRPYQQISCL